MNDNETAMVVEALERVMFDNKEGLRLVARVFEASERPDPRAFERMLTDPAFKDTRAAVEKFLHDLHGAVNRCAWHLPLSTGDGVRRILHEASSMLDREYCRGLGVCILWNDLARMSGRWGPPPLGDIRRQVLTEGSTNADVAAKLEKLLAMRKNGQNEEQMAKNTLETKVQELQAMVDRLTGQLNHERAVSEKAIQLAGARLKSLEKAYKELAAVAEETDRQLAGLLGTEEQQAS